MCPLYLGHFTSTFGFSCGRTREEALVNVREAIGLYIEVLKEDGEIMYSATEVN